MNQKEIWKPVVGYEGHYEISNFSRVRSVERHVKQSNHLRYVPKRIKKPRVNRNGYLCVTLCKDGESRERQLHRLLMEAFVPKPNGKTEIDHINTIRTDNRLENLRWCTAKENANNPITLKHARENTYTDKRNKKINQTKREKGIIKEVYQYTKDGVFVEHFLSSRDATRKTGVAFTQILSVLDDCTQSAGGYLWLSQKADNVRYIPRIHPSSKAVLHYDIDGHLLGEYQSIKKASKSTGITSVSIYRSINGRFKNPRKYIFRFKDNPL